MEAPKSIKQKIIDLLHRLPDDIDYDRAIEHIFVMRRIECVLQQSTADDVEHEVFMKELLGEDDEQGSSLLGSGGPAKSQVH